VTWLPVPLDGAAERDGVLGLKPEPYAALRQVLTAAWTATDPDVLELCRRRLAQLTGARAELAGVDQGALEDLEHRESSTTLGAHERAALAFAEQYHYDHRLLGDGLRGALEEYLTKRQLVNFVWALHMNDSYIRLMSLLDIEPDPETAPARPERTPPAGTWSPPQGDDAADELASVKTLMEPELEAAYLALTPIVVRQSLVDEVTSEAVRLRNASYQGCLY
jgi:alkylhydroperoxidase family enzyme